MALLRVRHLGALFFAVLSLAIPALATSSTVGLYTDVAGSSCSFSGNTAGVVTAYVVVKPDANGVRGVRFSAPAPGCLGAVYLGESAAPGALSIGESTTGVSVAFTDCALVPTFALQIQYLRTSTTPCCEFTIAADPIVGTIEGTDCAYGTQVLTPVVSHFNADATCPCNDQTPPYPPENPSPLDGLTTVSVFTNLTWSPSAYDADIESYDLYLGTDPDPAFLTTVTQPSYQPAQHLDELTQYYWRIVVRDDDGHTTAGPVWRFKTRALNAPPNPPAIVSPPNGATNVSVVTPLQWLASDIDGDVLEYDIHLGVEPDTPLYVAGLKTNTYTIITPLAYSTTYDWYVVARDPFGHETASNIVHFTTRPSNYPPGAATSPSPANNAIGVAVSPSLAWSASDPDPGDVLTFDIYLGTANPPPLVVTDHPTASYAASGLSFATKYYWKIVTRDNHGAISTSSTWNFTTRPENYPPAIPSTPSPSNGATNVAINTSLTWQCSDADGDAITYRVYFGTTNPPPQVATGVTDRTYSPGVLTVNTTYYWEIVAQDSRGASTTGPIWSFRAAANHAPNTPSSPSPADNATSQPLQVHLTWTCSDVDPGQTLAYDVYFGTSTSPPRVLIGLTTAAWDTPALSANTNYFWKIVAKDNLGATTTGPVWKFTTTTDQTPPGASNPVPADGATVYSTFLTLQWTAPDQFTQFTINFGTTATPPLYGTTSARSLDVGSLAYGQTYFWNVTAFDGVSSVRGPTWQFTVSGGGVPVLFSSFAGNVSGAAARITWELRGDEAMQSYTLYRRGDAGRPTVIVTAPVSGSSGSYLDTDVQPGLRYHYQMLVRTADGDEFRSPGVTVTMPALDLTLGPNHPNPFNPQTTIPYVVPSGSAPVRVRLVIYDSSGRVVKVLVDEDQSGGAREVVWNGNDRAGATVTSGIYFCVLQAGKEQRTQKLVLLK